MTEQRYGYTYHRVLIDSARVLDPQFPDSLIYVTGAQLELLRNMTQYLNRLSSYVSEYQPSYYLSPTIEDYDTIQAIVADLESVLMGNPNTIWGYYDQWFEWINEESVGAGTTIAETTPVPAGYVYRLEHLSGWHEAGAARYCLIQLNKGGNNPVLYEVPALPSLELVIEYPNMLLKEGDYIEMRVAGVGVGDFVRLRVLGYQMKVPE